MHAGTSKGRPTVVTSFTTILESHPVYSLQPLLPHLMQLKERLEMIDHRLSTVHNIMCAGTCKSTLDKRMFPMSLHPTSHQ